jgi:hypothetical protein
MSDAPARRVAARSRRAREPLTTSRARIAVTSRLLRGNSASVASAGAPFTTTRDGVAFPAAGPDD